MYACVGCYMPKSTALKVPCTCSRCGRSQLAIPGSEHMECTTYSGGATKAIMIRNPDADREIQKDDVDDGFLKN